MPSKGRRASAQAATRSSEMPGLVRRARSRRDQERPAPAGERLGGGQRVVALDPHRGAEFAQIMDQVPGEAVVIVEDEDQVRRPIASAPCSSCRRSAAARRAIAAVVALDADPFLHRLQQRPFRLVVRTDWVSSARAVSTTGCGTSRGPAGSAAARRSYSRRRWAPGRCRRCRAAGGRRAAAPRAPGGS